MAAAASACLLPMIASAQASYPARTITLVIPYAAGGPADAMARVLANQLQIRLKQTVIVDSKAGGAATIGTGFVARAQPDGCWAARSSWACSISGRRNRSSRRVR